MNKMTKRPPKVAITAMIKRPGPLLRSFIRLSDAGLVCRIEAPTRMLQPLVTEDNLL